MNRVNWSIYPTIDIVSLLGCGYRKRSLQGVYCQDNKY